MLRTTLLSAAAMCLSLSAAHAQEPIRACESQQELEQVLASEGTIMPDGCRNVNINALESNGQRLCLLDFSSSDEGVVDRLREAAVSQQWWVRCEDLEAAARP